jgi:hypothetical protein
MATLVLFDEFGSDLGKSVHNFSTGHTFKIALAAAANAPDQTTGATLSNITQISGGTGYTTGGVALTTPTWTETAGGSGIWKFVTDDLTLTGSGGGMGPFRYVILFNDTPTSPADPLIAYLDYGADITVTSGNTFLIDVGTSGWFQIPIT